MAPDVRSLNGRGLDEHNAFYNGNEIVKATGFTVDLGADVLNLSLGYGNSSSDASSLLSRNAVAITWERGIPVVASAGNKGRNRPSATPNSSSQGPGDAFNAFSVAASDADFDRIADFSSWSETQSAPRA
ncbi:hypothetical protein PSMK_31200 [Phycisphaera mikurensis NBRC 102666]|uniref:Peptidase S8/S53 domain-containing protein n=1 Tax=Phycisphaera mikurensis (strain NBRC 102666 / KCTC 22515 / FYK2301M01) TaxID=1142394 RepID=I0IJ41_PHYMF|nr:subtilisin family serine protease [Phycisphaera mikurensis]BAM05279.1 hypothetical protein PSMK_31200 [Phycisphaera mikurensis NBRC 102666]